MDAGGNVYDFKGMAVREGQVVHLFCEYVAFRNLIAEKGGYLRRA